MSVLDDSSSPSDPNLTACPPSPDDRRILTHAGGAAFAVDDWTRLDRFLILGVTSGTYYVSSRDLLQSNTTAILQCLETDGLRTVARTVEISLSGRAAKNDPAIFVICLALTAGNTATRQAAERAVLQVCRTGTHLFHLVHMADALRGWGRSLRRAIAGWYLKQTPDSLAFQVIKYRQRDGWSHADVLKLAHPRTLSREQQSIFRWIVAGPRSLGPRQVHRLAKSSEPSEYPACNGLPRWIEAFEIARTSNDLNTVIATIRQDRLPHEAIPNHWLAEPKVWQTLLSHMPLGAMIRNLPRLTALGVIEPGTPETRRVAAALIHPARLKRSRLHPFAILTAWRTYQNPDKSLGKLRWKPVPDILEALETAFYASFQNVVPIGRPLLLALDVSGSMSQQVLGTRGLNALEASAAIALITLATEPDVTIMAFSDDFIPVNLKPGMRLEEVMAAMAMPFGFTDCSLPMIWAEEQRRKFDGIVVYTDSETHARWITPAQALQNYRRAFSPNAKCVVVGMTATEISIADPNDRGMLDVVGCDAATPALIADFLREDARTPDLAGRPHRLGNRTPS